MRAFSIGVIIITQFLAFAVACDDGTDTNAGQAVPSAGSNAPNAALVTPIERPPGVPASAIAIEGPTVLGRFDPRPNAPPEQIDTRSLKEASCRNGVVMFRTSAETIYAALSCDRFWDAETAPAFVQKDMALVLEPTRERFLVSIETVEGAQARFPARGIWLE